jgi:hypothetical protein
VDKPTSWINQFASTFVVEKPFSIQSQIGYVEGNRLVEGIQKTSGNLHPVKVDHSRHSEEDYHFVVLMKWE